MCARAEVADVLRMLGDEEWGKVVPHPYLQKHLRAIRDCRTAALGGHVDACSGCGHLHISYNSCRNRHCPKCQGHKRQQWMQARIRELLPVPYFHVVFTLPQALNSLALHRPREVYHALFACAWQTIQQFAKNKQVQAGMVGILHTWGQNLTLHPHLHCIVPGGGVGAKGHWQQMHADGKFLFPVKAMSRVFRAKYVAELRAKGLGDKPLYDSLFAKEWVVYAKRPFGSTESVIEYLGRYTHKVAISNHRIQSVTPQAVTFNYKDYKAGGVQKQMQLTPREFTRRYAQHILPKGFVRIRHYGFLSSTWKRGKLKALQHLLHYPPPRPKETSTHLRRCPCCKTGLLTTIAIFDKRGPPQEYLVGDKRPACTAW